jgi:hypothetical protein
MPLHPLSLFGFWTSKTGSVIARVAAASRGWPPGSRERRALDTNLARGYGKPEQKSDVDVVHRFALVPEVMAREIIKRFLHQ